MSDNFSGELKVNMNGIRRQIFNDYTSLISDLKPLHRTAPSIAVSIESSLENLRQDIVSLLCVYMPDSRYNFDDMTDLADRLPSFIGKGEKDDEDEEKN